MGSLPIIEEVVIRMDEAQVHNLEQVRQVLAGTQELQFRPAPDDHGHYGWMEAVLRRLSDRQLGRADKGAVWVCLRRLSGDSRAQVTRLFSRPWPGTQLVKNDRAPEHAIARPPAVGCPRSRRAAPPPAPRRTRTPRSASTS